MTSTFDTLTQLAGEDRWADILELEAQALAVEAPLPAAFFILGLAHLRLGHPQEAERLIVQGRAIAPEDRWGLMLLLESLFQSGRPRPAIEALERYLERNPDDEDAKRLIADELAQLGEFQQARLWNERRSVMASPLVKARYAVVVQTFVKADTLDGLFASLCNCRGSRAFDLLVVQDSIVGSQKFSAFEAQQQATAEKIAQWLPRLSQAFATVAVHSNGFNRGTTATCQVALDHVARDHDGFIFFEDDCIVAENGLQWMQWVLDHAIDPDTHRGGAWFVAGESIFFSAKPGAAEGPTDSLRETSRRPEYRNAYFTKDFVPSTCFATRSDIWRACGGVRGLPRGDETLSQFMAANGGRCIMPIVPRVMDVGMTHPHGYSVAYHGVERVQSKTRTTVLLSDVELVGEEIVLADPAILKGAILRA